MAIVGQALSACNLDLPPPIGDATAAGGASTSTSTGGAAPACLQPCTSCEPKIVAQVNAETELSHIEVDQDVLYVRGGTGVIYRIEKDLGTVAVAVPEHATTLALWGGYIWWTRYYGGPDVRRAPTAELSAVETAAPIESGVLGTGIAIDETGLYWTTRKPVVVNAPTVWLATPPTTNLADRVPLAASTYCYDTILDESFVYFRGRTGRAIYRAPKSGTGEMISLVPECDRATCYVGLAVGPAFVYVTAQDQAKIISYNVQGNGLAGPTWDVGGVPKHLLRDGSHLYFVNEQANGSIDAIVNALEVDDTTLSPDQHVVLARLVDGSVPRQVAVDDADVYWTSQDNTIRCAPTCPGPNSRCNTALR